MSLDSLAVGFCFLAFLVSGAVSPLGWSLLRGLWWWLRMKWLNITMSWQMDSSASLPVAAVLLQRSKL
jgi:hypothetical protein